MFNTFSKSLNTGSFKLQAFKRKTLLCTPTVPAAYINKTVKENRQVTNVCQPAPLEISFMFSPRLPLMQPSHTLTLEYRFP